MKKFTREERATIALGFREEIKKYGIKQAIVNVLNSKSDKVPVRKTVLAQQCRKPAFRKQFEAACDQLEKTASMRSCINALRDEILKDVTC